MRIAQHEKRGALTEWVEFVIGRDGTRKDRSRGSVQAYDMRFGVVNDQPIGHGLDRRFQLAGPRRCLSLRLTERRLDLFTLADIPDGAEEVHAIRRRQGAEADLNGELAPIFAPAKEFEVSPHRTRMRGGRVILTMLGMHGMVPLGNQGLHALANELLPRIPEEHLRLAVDEHDGAITRCDDDGIWSGFQQSAELSLCGASWLRMPSGLVLCWARVRASGRSVYGRAVQG